MSAAAAAAAEGERRRRRSRKGRNESSKGEPWKALAADVSVASSS